MYCTKNGDFSSQIRDFSTPWTLNDPTHMQLTCDRIMEEIFGEYTNRHFLIGAPFVGFYLLFDTC